MGIKLFSSKGAYEYLLVGLGNPGPKYLKTRHNVGFMTLDLIMARCGKDYSKKRFKALTGDIEVSGVKILTMKPETFMNNSGEAVGAAASYYKIPPEKVIIISDDVSLPVGKMRIRKSGSAGGHNGLKSIIAHLNSDGFPRIKIGVGSKEPEEDLADHVLGDIPKAEMDAMKFCAENCVEAVELIVTGQTDKAMNKYN